MNTAVFIDFQGTIGGSGTDDIRSLELYPFTAQAIKLLNDCGYLVMGITNQSHISKGDMTNEEYLDGVFKIDKTLSKHGAHFDVVYMCPHTDADNCTCKKPKTGLVDDAVEEFDIDIKSSYIIGDMGMSDMLLAKNVNAKGILVLTGVGKGSLNEYRHTWANFDPYHIAENLLEAVYFIIKD